MDDNDFKFGCIWFLIILVGVVMVGLIGMGPFKDLHEKYFSHKDEKAINYNNPSINAAQPVFNGNISNGNNKQNITDNNCLIKCPACNGCGKVVLPNGYVTTCLCCEGRGGLTKGRLNAIRNNVPVNLPPVNNNIQNQGRSRVEIAFEIQKQVDLINSSQNDFQMMENDGNYILADEMRNNISKEEDLLYKLKEEYNEATH